MAPPVFSTACPILGSKPLLWAAIPIATLGERDPPSQKIQKHRRLVRLERRNARGNEPTPYLVGTTTAHFSGADIEGLVELAKDFVLEEYVSQNSERAIRQEDLLRAARGMQPSTLDWLRTARNLVKYAGADASYGDVERYLKTHKLL
jgi:SpoVK/Ycf46/Vps4 family AAA+-type ATPase